MAVNVNQRIDDPSQADVDYYVGLEHLDPDSLKIRRWGNPSDVAATKLIFRKGDIIFGRRRVYQRKVAVADFDGICSAHALVLRSRPEVALPEFLPFFMQSDLFMERAKAISVGSLSPTINWKTLAKERFTLPSLEEQKRILDTLKAFDLVTESYFSAYENAIQIENSFLKEQLGKYGKRSREFQYVPLRKVAVIQSGVAKGRKFELGKTVEMPYLRVANVQDGHLDLSEIKSIVVEKERLEQYLLRDGDVLMTEGGDLDKLGRGTVWKDQIPNCVHQNHIFAVRPNKEILNSCFLAAVAKSIYGKQYFLSQGKRTSNLATINKTEIGNFLLPLPSLRNQERLVAEWQSLQDGTVNLRKRLTLIQSIRNQHATSCLGGSI